MKQLILILLLMVMLAPAVFGIFGADLYYKLEDITEEGSSTNNLSITGTVYFTDGLLGDAQNMTGGGFTRLSPAYTPNFTNQLTINFWVKYNIETPATNSEWPVTLERDAGAGVGQLIAMSRQDTRRMRVFGQQNGGSICFVQIGSHEFHADIWYMVTLIFDGVNAKFYINDTLDFTKTCNYDWSGVDRINIGAYWNDVSIFDGMIDDVKIMPTNQSEAWIAERYNNGVGLELGPEPDVTPPVITIVTPANGTILNDDVHINLTTDEETDCTANNTAFNLIEDTGTFFSFQETSLADKNYNVEISCDDLSLNNAVAVVNFSKVVPIVTIHRPPNDSLIRENPVNLTFQFDNFDASNCTLYTNNTDSGEFESKQSIALGVQNVTEFINISQNKINLTDKYALYRFEEGSGSIAIDLIAGNNGTISAGAVYNESKLTNGTGNFSLNFSTALVSIPNADYLDFGTSQDFSISAWVQTDILDSQYHMIFDSRDAGGDGVFLAIATGDILQIAVDAVTMDTSTTISDNDWHFIVATVDRDNAGNTDIWIDTVSQGVGELTSAQDVDTVGPAFIGRRSFSAGTYWDGRIDEVIIWDKALSSSEITKLYNDGVPFVNITTIENTTTINQTLNESENITFLIDVIEPENERHVLFYVNCFDGASVNSSIYLTKWDADFTPPTIDILFPSVSNDTFNQNMHLNISIDETGTCSVNNSDFILQSFNDTFFFFAETALINQYYSINVSCSDDSVVPNQDHVIVDFTKDVLFPVIETFYPNEDNSTEVGTTETTIELISNITENNDLFSIEVNLTYIKPIVGKTLLFHEFLNVSGTNYIYTREINTSIFPQATIKEEIRVCDSHTGNNIKPATSIDKAKDNIKFKFGDIVIHVKSLDKESKSTDYLKKKDRYTFDFEYDSVIPVKRFKLTSNTHIDYIQSSGYKGHFVIGNHWADFENNGDVEVEKITDENETFYIITVHNEDTVISFNSIGELNCLLETYTFDVGPVNPTNALLLSECPNTTSGMLALMLICGIALFFVILSFMFKIGFIGVFGSFMLMVISWYLAPCLAIFALIIGLLSFMLLIWFALTGLGFVNNTLK